VANASRSITAMAIATQANAAPVCKASAIIFAARFMIGRCCLHNLAEVEGLCDHQLAVCTGLRARHRAESAAWNRRAC
jgi:hypothetical protein